MLTTLCRFDVVITYMQSQPQHVGWDAVAVTWDAVGCCGCDVGCCGMLWLQRGMLWDAVAEMWDAVAEMWDAVGCCGWDVYGIILIEKPCTDD